MQTDNITFKTFTLANQTRQTDRQTTQMVTDPRGYLFLPGKYHPCSVDWTRKPKNGRECEILRRVRKSRPWTVKRGISLPLPHQRGQPIPRPRGKRKEGGNREIEAGIRRRPTRLPEQNQEGKLGEEAQGMWVWMTDQGKPEEERKPRLGMVKQVEDKIRAKKIRKTKQRCKGSDVCSKKNGGTCELPLSPATARFRTWRTFSVKCQTLF